MFKLSFVLSQISIMSLNNLVDVFSDTSETKIEDRFGIASPIPMIVIIVLYLLIVLKIGPSLMKSRAPYQLKTFIIIYNIFQVFSCSYIVYKVLKGKIPIFRFWQCVAFEPNSAMARNFNHVGILTFWLKASELSETFVFVLRKKQRQVSFLHVFHHSSMLFLTYQIVKFYKTSSAYFPLFLNCNVHIVMYCYYLLAAALPSTIAAKLTPLKKFITTIQMVQFSLILMQIVTDIMFQCNVPITVLIMYMVIVSAFFYMFYDFYKKNYNAKRRSSVVS